MLTVSHREDLAMLDSSEMKSLMFDNNGVASVDTVVRLPSLPV